MKNYSLKNLGQNKVEINYLSGLSLLFSYNTLVSVFTNGRYIKTSKNWSRTTSRHVNSWILPNFKVEEMSQDELVNTFLIGFVYAPLRRYL